MGYSTEFYGEFKLMVTPTDEQVAEFTNFQSNYQGDGVGKDGEKIDFGTRNYPPKWCPWEIQDKGEEGLVLTWDDSEKAQFYAKWLKYVVEKFFKPWGIPLNGEILWQGDDDDDCGKLVIDGFTVLKYYGAKSIVYNLAGEGKWYDD